jgi:PTS system nitrogen regulatory IIA component
MRLADILDIGRVSTSLVASDKSEVLHALAEMFSGQDAEEIFRVFVEREALASTGVGSGVAIPHGRLGAVDRLQAALAVSRDGVEFDAVDGQPAHIFIAVLAPERHTGDHLKALARISRLLRDGRVRSRLLEATDPSAALSVVLDEEARLG